MLENQEVHELELLMEEGDLLFTPWVLDERSLMAGYEAAGSGSLIDRFWEWWDKVKAFFKKVNVATVASMKKLELDVNNQAKQWDSIKNDVGGKEPYKIEVTKTNFLLNSQGLSWYADQLKKMDSWTDTIYKAVPEFRKAVVAALAAARDASDVAGVKSAMETLSTALSTYYTAVGTNIPEIAPITVETGGKNTHIQKKSQDTVDQAVGKYYFAEKTTASLGPEWCGSALSAIQPFPTVGKKIFDRVNSSTADWDREIGNAKNQIKGVLDKYSDKDQKQAVAKAMSTFMKSVKEGMKVDQQINSLMGKNLSSAHATSGVLSKAMNHFSSGGKNKEGQKTEGGEQQQGKEMFSFEAYGMDHTDMVLSDLLNISTEEEAGYEDLEAGTEGFFLWEWIKKFFKWLGSLFSSEEKSAEACKSAKTTGEKISKSIADIKDEKVLNTAIDKPGVLPKGAIQKVSELFGKINITPTDDFLVKVITAAEPAFKAMADDSISKTTTKIPKEVTDAVNAAQKLTKGAKSELGTLIKSTEPFKPKDLKTLKEYGSSSGILKYLQVTPMTSIKVSEVKDLADELGNISDESLEQYKKQLELKKRNFDKLQIQGLVQKEGTKKKPSKEWLAIESSLRQSIMAVWNAMVSVSNAKRICARFIITQARLLARIYSRKIEPLTKDDKKEDKKEGKESFSSLLMDSDLAVDLYSDEVLDETIRQLEERQRYLEAREYIGYGAEGFFDAIGDFIGKILEAIGNFFSWLFGGSSSSSGGGDSGSSSSGSTPSLEKKKEQLAKQVQAVDAALKGIDISKHVNKVIEEFAKAQEKDGFQKLLDKMEKDEKEREERIRKWDEELKQKQAERDREQAEWNKKKEEQELAKLKEQKAKLEKEQKEQQRQFKQVKIWWKKTVEPLLNIKTTELELPTVALRNLSRYTFNQHTRFAILDALKVISDSRLVKDISKTCDQLDKYVAEYSKMANSSDDKQKTELISDLQSWLRSFDSEFSDLTKQLKQKIDSDGGATDAQIRIAPNGRLTLKSLARVEKRKWTSKMSISRLDELMPTFGSFIGHQLDASVGNAQDALRAIDNVWRPFDKGLRAIQKTIAPLKGDRENKFTRAVRVSIMKFAGKCAVFASNLMTIGRDIKKIISQNDEVTRAWDAIFRSLINEHTKKIMAALMSDNFPKENKRLLSAIIRQLRREVVRKKGGPAAYVWCGYSLSAIQKALTRVGEEAFGTNNPFWFLDAPHISDEKALEMFEQLISEETEDKIQKQVENLDENNEQGYNPDAGADMAVEIAGLENQLKVFAYGDLQVGQEGFFDAALRLLTSLADMVSRLFSTFKLVYRSFQGLKRTEYQSYKEKYAATLMRVKRQSYSDVMDLSVPHPKGLQTKYINVVEQLIATLQACDMPARSKGFAITAKNLRNQLEEGVSTEGTVGALFMQAGEVERIRKLWEDSEKCFKGSGNTAEFKTLYSSMEEFNRVLDRIDDAAHFEYDVAKVYSNLNDCNDYLQSAVKYAKTRKAGDGMPISKAELVSLSEACLFMAKTFDVYGLTIQLENRVQHNVVEDVKTIVRSKKL